MPQAKKLNSRQRRFASELVFGKKKQSEALIAAGWTGDPRYAKDTASKIMALPHVRAYIEKLELQALEQEGVTHAGIVRDIVTVKDRCMQAEPVLDHEGEPTGEWQFREHGALKALDMLGKYKRLWSDSVASAPVGPGLTVIVQQGVQVQGQQAVQTHRVEVQLPKPA